MALTDGQKSLLEKYGLAGGKPSEAASALQEKAAAKTKQKDYGYKTPETVKKSNFTTGQRQLLAKYGLADYTEGELKEANRWNAMLQANQQKMNDAYMHLSQNDWAGYSQDSQYRDELARQKALLTGGDWNVTGINSDSLQKYGDYLQSLTDEYERRRWRSGFAANEDEFKAYQMLPEIQEQLGKNGWEDLQKDRGYRGALGVTLQAAQRELAAADPSSKHYQELQQYVQDLQDMNDFYGGRIDLLDSMPDQQHYEALLQSNDYYTKNAESGLSNEQIYQQTVDAADALRRQSEELQGKEPWRRELQQQKLDELAYYMDRSEYADYYDPQWEALDKKYGDMSREELEALRQQLQAQIDGQPQELTDLQKQLQMAELVSQYASLRRYDDIRGSDEWNQQVEKGKLAYEQDKAARDANKLSTEDITRSSIAFGGDYAGLLEASQIRANDDSWREPNDNWTKEQAEEFFFQYATDPAAALSKAADINSAYNYQKQAEQQKQLEEWTNRGWLNRTAAWGAGVLSAPFQLVDYYDKVNEYALRGRVTTKENMTPGEAATAMTAAAANYLNQNYATAPEGWAVVGGKGLGDVFQLTQSIAQSALYASLGGGAVNTLFFGSAANQGFADAKARGASDGQALILGFLNGSAEVIGETLSIESLIAIKNPTTVRKYLVNIAKQGGIEASEEAFTTLMNTFADMLVLGDKSELVQHVQNYMAQGMSKAEAEKKAWADWTEGIAFDALSGFLSGGISAGGRQAVGMVQASRTEYAGADRTQILELAKQQPQNSEAYKLAMKVENQGTMSQLEAEQLTDLLGENAMEGIRAGQREELKERARNALLQEGFGERTAGYLSETVTREILGEELDEEGKKQRDRSYKNQKVQRVTEQLQSTMAREERSRWWQAQMNRQETRDTNAVKSKMRSAFQASKLQISDADLEMLNDGFVAGFNKPNSYVIAMRDAYRLGKSGMTLEKAAQSSEYSAKVMETQFRHAWELGARSEGKPTGTVNKAAGVTVEGLEGKGKIQAISRDSSGELVLTVENGSGQTKKASLEDVNFDESGLGELMQSLKDREDAEAMFAAYDGTSPASYIAAWDAAKAFGRKTTRTTVEQILKDPSLQGASEEMVKAAFAYGREQKAAERKKTTSVTAAGRSATSQEGGGKNKGAAKSGKYVSFEGGTVDGRTLKAVEQDKLSRKQKAQISLVASLAQEKGIRVVFFQSDANQRGQFLGSYGMYKDGTIYIDVNAGMRGRNLGQVAIVRTAAHELTHYIQDFSEERYEELQEFLLDHIAEYKGMSLGELAAQKQARSEQELTMEEALDEVIADGCEMMLRRGSVMEQMAEEKPGLYKLVKSWVKKWLQGVQEAFQGVSAVHDEARAVEAMEAKRLQEFTEIWYKGLFEASERAAKSPAREGGETKYSLRDKKIPTRDELEAKDDLPVVDIRDETKGSYKEQREAFLNSEKAKELYRKPALNRDTNEPLFIVPKSITHTFNNAGQENILLAKHLREIAENAVLTHGEQSHSAPDDHTTGVYKFFGAVQTHDGVQPVKLTVKEYNVEGQDVPKSVLDYVGDLRKGDTYAHIYDGKVLVLENIEKETSSSAPSSTRNKSEPDKHPSVSAISVKDLLNLVKGEDNKYIPQRKTSTKFQNREELPEDRELLMAAKAEGKNAEALTAYQKKVKALEAMERKLQRQRAELEQARKAAKDTSSVTADAATPSPQGEGKALRKAAVEGWMNQIRKTEASILRAEKALDNMERQPAIRQEAEKALAAWREANPHEAARAIREMRQEQESLRAYVKLLREEARLTTPETRRMLPSDVRKMARALVKQGGSMASVDSITEKLQALGDFMASNLQGADTGYFTRIKDQARRIAREIVSESYETIGDNREIREGIRQYLREHTLNSEELRGDIPDFDRWRKSQMGTLRLGKEGISIDQAYQDLRSSYGEGFFPSDVMAASDQMQQILNTLEAVQPSYQQIFSTYEGWQAAEALGNEIVDRLLSGEVRERETMADKAYRQRMQQLEEKYARKDKARQQALNDAEDRARYEAIKRDEAEEKRREERALRRQLVAEKVHELRERSIENDKRYRARIAIDKKVVALSKIMLENSGKKHVPDAWKEVVGNFLGSIDTLTKHSGEKSRSFHIERIEALRDMAAQQQARNEGREETGPQVFLDLNPYVAEMLKPFLDMARDSSTGMIEVEKLDLAQMKQLEEILTALREAVDKADVMLAAAEKGETLSSTAGDTVSYLEEMGKGKTGGMLRRFLGWDNLTPVYFFKRFGPAGERVFRSLQQGWGKLAFNAKQIIDFSEDTYTAKEAKEWEKEVHEFKLIRRESDLSGRESLTKAAKEGGPEAVKEAEERNKETVKISTAQLMGLYCLVKREQARGHILGGGIRIWDIGAKKGTVEQAERYLVTAEDIAEMTKALTDRQREVADKLQKYMNTVGSSWGNEVSQARFGVDLFTENNYYPISTDPMSRNARSPEADGTDLFHILNMGFTKNTVKNASNGVVIHSIFDVFSNHMADMAKYNSMGLPMLDAMKWFNYLDETDGKFTSVRKAMETAYGKNAERYFLGFIQDLNGSFEGGRRGEDVATAAISNEKVAAVGANLRVAFLQPTSYVRALAVLDPKYLLIGDNPLKIKQGMEEALQYSGTAVWKDLGFFDMNINSNMRDLIKHADTTLDKVRELSMWGAEMGDKTTWGRLWNATKAETQAKTGLTGEALLKATAERFDDVIYQTQVMDSTMTRSHLMRQKGAFASMMTSFMSEPTLSYNLLLDAVTKLQTAKRTGKGLGTAIKMAARAFATYALSQVVASFVESLFDALRDDDDYEDFLTKWKQAEFGWDGNLMQDLALHNKLPYLRDLVSIVQGFTNKRMDTEWMTYWMAAIKAIQKDWEAGELTWPTAYKSMKALSTLTGVPLANAGRDAVALWNRVRASSSPDWQLKLIHMGTATSATSSIKQAYTAGALSEEEAIRYLMRDAGVETEEKAKQKVFEWGLEKGEKKYDALLDAVKAGDSAAAAEARKTLTENGYADKTIDSAVREAAKEWYQGTGDNPGPRISKEEAIRILTEQGGMSRADAEKKVNEWTAYVSSPEQLQYEDIQDAFLDGEISESRAVQMRVLYGGQSQAEAESDVRKWACERDTGIAYNDLEKAYINGQISDEEAIQLRMKYGGQTRIAAEKTLDEWKYAAETGNDYGNIRKDFVAGTLSREDAIAARVNYGGQTRIAAEKEVQKWTCEKETGINYDQMKDLFLSGELSESKAIELRKKYGGQSQAEAEKDLLEWRCKKETGIEYDNIREAYLGKEISQAQARTMLMTYGGKNAESAAEVLAKYDFAGTDPELQDISGSAASTWYNSMKAENIPKSTWYATWKQNSSATADKDENGKSISGSKKDKMTAYIDKLSLSAAQKDLLYLGLGYAKSGLKDTPWH